MKMIIAMIRPERLEAVEEALAAVLDEGDNYRITVDTVEGRGRQAGEVEYVRGRNFNVVASIELEGPVTQPLLVRALEEVQREQECLRVEVVRELGTRDHYVFRRTDERPRLEVSADDWRAVWDRLCDQAIDG